MHARAFCVITLLSLSNCLTIHQNNEPDIETHSKEELPPLFIVCNLTDIVTITAPGQHNNNALYYLYNPNNELRKLHINRKDVTNEKIKNASVSDKIVYKYEVRNVNFGQKINSTTNDSFGGINDFVIGPVGEEDHGNWVLSVYYKKNGSWVEEFQVITIQIVDYVPIQPPSPVIIEGDTLELGFAYPLSDLVTCELIQPSANRPYDRYFRLYELTSLHTCTYVIRNLSTQESGLWKIVGVGNIVYEGRSSVEVKELLSKAEVGRNVENLLSKTQVRRIGENLLSNAEVDIIGGISETLPLVSSSDGTKYLNFNIILPVGLILKIYCW